jgi:hypothetical protein
MNEQPTQSAERVEMLPNMQNATWQPLPYGWNAAINALGHAYDLRRVNATTGEVLEERTKVSNKPEAPPVKPTSASQDAASAFEAWWSADGAKTLGEENKDTARMVFNAGFGARR